MPQELTEEERERRRRAAIASAQSRIQNRASTSIVGASDVPQGRSVGPPAPGDLSARQAALQAASDRLLQKDVSAQRRLAYEEAPEISKTGIASIMTPPGEGETFTDMAGRQARGLGTSAAALTTFDPWELGKILMEQDPNIGIQQTPDGEFFAINRKTNKIVSLNKPGMSVMDAMQLLGTGLISALSANPSTMPGRMLAAGGSQAAIQAGQEYMGGDFDTQDVVLDTAISGAFDAPGAYRSWRAGADIPTDTLNAAQTVARAGEMSGGRRAAREVAEQAGINRGTVESAERLGVRDDLPLSTYSDNEQFRAVQAGLTARPGSDLAQDQADSIAALSENVARRFDEYGAASSRGGLDETIRLQMSDDIASLAEQSDLLYRSINKAVDRFGGRYQPVETRALDGYFNQVLRAYPSSDSMPTALKNIYEQTQVDGGMTYEALDRLRRSVGEQYASALRGSNPYPDTDTRSLGQLYDVITNQQNSALEGIVGSRGVSLWDAAKGLVTQRKQLEQLSISTLGRDLANDVMPGIERSLTNIARGNIRTFREKINAVPPELRPQVMMTALQSMVQKNARSADVDKNFAMSLSYFPNWWRQIKSDDAVYRLVTEYLTPEQTQFIDDVARVGGSLQRTMQKQPMNGRIIDFVENFSKPGGLISRVLGNAAGYVPIVGRPIQSGLDLLAGSGSNDRALSQMSDLLRDRGFREMVLTGAENGYSQNLGAYLLNSTAFNRWFEAAPQTVQDGIISIGRAATRQIPNASIERIITAGAAEYFTRSNFDDLNQFFNEGEKSGEI